MNEIIDIYKILNNIVEDKTQSKIMQKSAECWLEAIYNEDVHIIDMDTELISIKELVDGETNPDTAIGYFDYLDDILYGKIEELQWKDSK